MPARPVAAPASGSLRRPVAGTEPGSLRQPLLGREPGPHRRLPAPGQAHLGRRRARPDPRRAVAWSIAGRASETSSAALLGSRSPAKAGGPERPPPIVAATGQLYLNDATWCTTFTSATAPGP